MINIKGLNKTDVLAALYNASKPQGMGFIHYDHKPMTQEEAKMLLQQTHYFDYLKGRVMKVDISGDELNPWGYDRDNGQGAAERAISELLKTGDANSPTIQATHNVGTQDSVRVTKAHLDEKNRVDDKNEVTIFRLGLSDMADELGPAIDKATKKS